MSGATRIGEILRRPPVIALLAASVLGLLLWFGLPLIGMGEEHPLAGISVRLGALLFVALCWGGANLLLARNGQRDGIVRAEAATRRAARTAERAAKIDSRTATDTTARRLRATDRLLGGRTSDLPLFLLLGPTGAGKTALIAQSGLPFPLQARAGVLPESGVATEEAAVWLAEKAIFLDTPGYFAGCAPLSLSDQAKWHGFLGLLRQRRPSQAVNGILLTVSLETIARASDAERTALARNLRYRITDLEARFGFRPPCHLIFTHTDTVSGFSEFFAGVPAVTRAGQLGVEIPPIPNQSLEKDVLRSYFHSILVRLTPAVSALLQRELDAERRVRILEFPAQFAAQSEAVVDFLTALLEPSRQVAQVYLRRFTFTSVPGPTEELDLLAPILDDAFGLAPLPPTESKPVQRRASLFIHRLLDEILPAEAGLAGFDPRQRRRAQRSRLALASGSGALALTLGVAFTLTWTEGRDHLKNAEAAATEVELGLTRITAGASHEARLEVLDALRTAAERHKESFTGIGGEALDETDKLAEAAYRRGLSALLYPELTAYLHAKLSSAIGQGAEPAEVFAALRAYRVILGQGPFDAALLRAALQDLPRPYSAVWRASHARHVDAVLNAGAPLPGATVDTSLIELGLARLRGWSSVELGYAILQSHPSLKAMPEWRVADHAGPAGARVLARRSNRGLLQGVAGMYTAAAFHDVVKALIPIAAREAMDVAWVLGESSLGVTAAARRDRSEANILALYLDDYARAWEGLLADIGIFPFSTVEQTLDVLNALSTTQSPLRLFLLAAASETTLTTPAVADSAAAGRAPAIAGLDGVSLASGHLTGPLARGLVAAIPSPQQPGQPINDRFSALHEFVRGVNGQPAELEALTAGFRELYEQLLQASFAPDSGRAMLAALQGTGGNQARLRLQGILQRSPASIRRTVEPAVQRAQNVARITASDQANAAWHSRLLPVCRTLLDRFPFNPTAGDEAALGDVTSLFGPTGQLNAFFEEHLKPHINVTTTPWTLRRTGGASFAVSPAMLAFLERAELLRTALFSLGAESPRGRFEIEPVELDVRALEMLLVMNGSTLSYRHGPTTPRQFDWPSATPAVRLTFSPPIPGEISSAEFRGPWALHRLLARATRQTSTKPEETLFRIDLGARWTVLSLRASSPANPFSVGVFDGLRCPEAL